MRRTIRITFKAIKRKPVLSPFEKTVISPGAVLNLKDMTESFANKFSG